MVVGETGVIGAHAVYGVGLGPVSGGGKYNNLPPDPGGQPCQRPPFSNKPCNEGLCPGMCGHSILTKLTILKEMFKRGLNCKTA